MPPWPDDLDENIDGSSESPDARTTAEWHAEDLHGGLNATVNAIKAETIAQLEAEALERAGGDALAIPLTQKAAANGVATLGSDGLVPSTQLPETLDPVAYVHNQNVPEPVWVITHNLAVQAINVTVVDSAGTVVQGDVVYDSPNQITLTFSSAFSGKAYLS